jgi:hypothetical protein
LTPSTAASPIGTFNYAHSFWGAARALNTLEWEDRETHSDSPSEFLYWHSIELFLKAFLLADGVSIKKLRGRDFGHNITNLAEEAVNRGLALSDRDKEVLSYMPDTGAMIDLRYLKVGIRTIALPEEIEETCKSLYRLVGKSLIEQGWNIGFHTHSISF